MRGGHNRERARLARDSTKIDVRSQPSTAAALSHHSMSAPSRIWTSGYQVERWSSEMSGTTVSIAIAGPRNWTVVRKKNGKTLLTGNWNLADDGKTLTDHFSSIQANGTTSTVNYVYARTAGDSGFLGSWEAKSDDNSAFELQIQPWEGDGISFVDASEGLTRNMKFDGKDYPSAGGFPESAASGRRVNERTVEVTDRIKGRIADTQEVEVSADGKTLTITERPSGQRKPNILVFERE